MAIEDHARRRPGTVLHLHSDCMGVLEWIWCIYISTWDDKLSATDNPLRSGARYTVLCSVFKQLAAASCSI